MLRRQGALMDSLVAWLAAPGVIGLLYGLGRLGYKLHQDAIEAERRRADDARAGREAAEKRADLREEQFRMLLEGIAQQQRRQVEPPLPPQPPAGPGRARGPR